MSSSIILASCVHCDFCDAIAEFQCKVVQFFDAIAVFQCKVVHFFDAIAEFHGSPVPEIVSIGLSVELRELLSLGTTCGCKLTKIGQEFGRGIPRLGIEFLFASFPFRDSVCSDTHIPTTASQQQEQKTWFRLRNCLVRAMQKFKNRKIIV